MRFSRRRLLQMAASALVLAQVSACGAPESELSDEEIIDGLARLARDFFPHDSVPDEKYRAIAKHFMGQDRTVAALIVADLGQETAFTNLPDHAREARIRDRITTPGMQAFRMAALIGLYHDLEVTSAFGYQGPSFEEYGYIERGFNDLDWLPEPPVGDPKEWGQHDRSQ